MATIGFDKEVNAAIDRYNRRFGKDAYFSIDPLIDPLNPDGPASLGAIKLLDEAVKSGRPLPTVKPPKNVLY